MNVVTAAGVALCLVSAPLRTPAARADDDGKRVSRIETEHMFGFLIGADTGDVGEKEVETGYLGRFGKRRGHLRAQSQEVELEYVPWRNFRTSIGGSLAQHNSLNPEGSASAKHSGFQSFFFDARYGLLERERSGFGLTVAAEPRWARMEDATGAPGREFGLDLTLAGDVELIKNHVVAALNVTFDIDASRPLATRSWKRESKLGIASALMTRVYGSVFVGGEVRYVRAYEGFGLDRLEGHALFAGPALYVQLTEKTWLSASWSTQVAGRSAEEPARLDLVNFERQEARVKMGIIF